MNDAVNKIDGKIQKAQEELRLLKEQKKKAIQQQKVREKKKKEDWHLYMGEIISTEMQICFGDLYSIDMDKEEFKTLVEEIFNPLKNSREEDVYDSAGE